MFSTDPGKIFDFSSKKPADIFNEAILPTVNSFMDLVGNDPGGLEEASQRRKQRLEQNLSREALSRQEDDAFLANLMEQRDERQRQPVGDVEGYDEPVSGAPTGDFDKTNIKLANYGYDSDSSPDHNSNTLRIGHANNKLVDGYSAALTKSLAKRYGLKTGDEFQVVTADGKTMTRRYDDTVPTTYKGKPLPETVDLYERGGSNKFGGKVVGIRPLKRSSKKLDLPAENGDISEYDNPILPSR